MKIIKLSILTLIISVFFISCHTSRGSLSTSYYEPIMESTSGMLMADNDKSLYANEQKVERKVIFSAYISLIIKNADTVNSHIEKIAKKYNGYVNQIGTNRSVIRVKSNHLENAVKDILILGKVQSKSLSGQDVTESYLDYQIRLENAEKARKRYLELLAKAENVEAALKVEKELERLNGMIDMFKGKMNRINHLSEFSTITINLKVKKKPGILGYVGIGVYKSVKWLFVRN